MSDGGAHAHNSYRLNVANAVKARKLHKFTTSLVYETYL